MVTPYAGVWIEIRQKKLTYDKLWVTPYAGVWIEICLLKHSTDFILSLPTRECGLKFLKDFATASKFSHSLRGSVD